MRLSKWEFHRMQLNEPLRTGSVSRPGKLTYLPKYHVFGVLDNTVSLMCICVYFSMEHIYYDLLLFVCISMTFIHLFLKPVEGTIFIFCIWFDRRLFRNVIQHYFKNNHEIVSSNVMTPVSTIIHLKKYILLYKLNRLSFALL